MAQKGVQLDAERFSCSICLDLLKDPVMIACGHNYCMNCINKYWDDDDDEEEETHSCPQCQQTFRPRPVLGKNTMLAELVEELKKTGLLAAPGVHCYAGAEDVACDFCTGRKLKAIKSCLVCQVSYCETHLQPHYDVAPLKKHKLVEPSKNIQENICSRHDEMMKILCHTDQQIICYLCSMDHLKGHDTVSAAAQRTEKQREVEGSQRNIHQRIQDREEDVKLLQQPVEAINRSADKTVEDKRFTLFYQVLSKESLSGRCYWEVEWSGDRLDVAVTYPRSSRIGVFLDHSAGLLSFYSVSETMTLLHRVQTTFTKPLYAGLGVWVYGTTAELVKVN
ncbi:E3 ubiquitin-protein ligase TRIM47-like [Pholidichthys leucotaenia]